MANLNLSEFGEKLFVADADHTFIWDSAASISKRVSRNSWLNSGTLTSDAPVTISQTWNQIGTAFTAFKVNAVSTASASGSLLLDLQLGGVSKFYVTKTGGARIPEISLDDFTYFQTGSGLPLIIGTYHGVRIRRDSTSSQAALLITTPSTGTGDLFRCSTLDGGGVVNGNPFTIAFDGSLKIGGTDTILLRDGAANTLALRNGTSAQTFNVYGTYTSGSVYERMFMRYNGTDLAFQVGAETLGATARPLQLWTGGASRLHITTAGNVGIGTTAPGAKLQVVGNAIFGENSISTSIVNVSFGGSYGTAVAGSKANLKWDLFNDGAGNRSGIGISAGIFEFQGGPGAGFGFYPNGSTTSALQIISSGNVGIGTTSPTSKLHVVGDAFLAANGSNTAPSLRIGAGAYVNGWYSFGGLQLNGVVNSLNMFGINLAGTNISAGNLSFGSGDAVFERDGEADHIAMRRGALGQKFSVYGTYPGANWERFTITAPTSGNVLLGTYKGTGGIARGLEFQTDGVTRMSVGPTGNIGIGTPASSSKLEVSGSVDVTLLRTGFYVQANTQFMFGSGGTGDVAMQRNAAGVMEINSTTAGTFRDLRVRSVIQQPPATITPDTNGDLVVEATSNTTLTFKLKGTDGTVRSGTITLSV